MYEKQLLTELTLRYKGILQVFTNVVVISAVIIVCYIAYLLWWPMEPITFDHKMLDIDSVYAGSDCAKTKEGLYIFHPGDVVPLKVSGVKHMNIAGQVMPRYIDSTVTLLPDYTAMRPIGRFEEVMLTHRVPKGSGSGIHYFEFNTLYEVNPFRKIIYQTRTVPFWVEADPPTKGIKGDKGEKGDKGDRG